MNPTTPGESLRLNLQLPEPERSTLERAASIRGRSLDDFAQSVLLEKARELLQAETLRVLSTRDAVRFVELLDADTEPNETLRRAAARYRGRHE